MYSDVTGTKLDIFVEHFAMCHELPLAADRLVIDARTVPLAELFLTERFESDTWQPFLMPLEELLDAE